jgi:hypothetical protein
VTYLQRYTLLAAVGMATSQDDDGKSAGEQQGNTLKEDLVVERLDAIANCRDLIELQKVHSYACKMAQEADDKGAELAFIKASNARKVELRASR